MISLQPICFRKCRANPPTPPVAPVTKTRLSAFNPWACDASTASAAVNPAVPKIIACFADKPSGNATIHEAGTTCTSLKPPSCLTPRPKPVTNTSSPDWNFSSLLSIMVPAKSMPGVIGYSRNTPVLGLVAKASL